MNITKSVIFLIVMPGAVMVYLPYYLLSLNIDLFFPDINGFKFLGFIPALIGSYLIFWCWKDFIKFGKGTPSPTDPPEKLVVKGLYRLTRNPMYVGVGFVLFGEILFFESTVLIIYTFLILFVFHLFVVLYEEPALKKKFGNSYKEYIDSVPRWLPKLNSIYNIFRKKNS